MLRPTSKRTAANLILVISNALLLVKPILQDRPMHLLYMEKKKKGFAPKVGTYSTVVANVPFMPSLKCGFCLSKACCLRKCPDFQQKSLKICIKIMRKKRLCDNCGKCGYISKFFHLNSVCTVQGCKRKHRTLLYDKPQASSLTRSKPEPLKRMLCHPQNLVFQVHLQ